MEFDWLVVLQRSHVGWVNTDVEIKGSAAFKQGKITVECHALRYEINCHIQAVTNIELTLQTKSVFFIVVLNMSCIWFYQKNLR